MAVASEKALAASGCSMVVVEAAAAAVVVVAAVVASSSSRTGVVAAAIVVAAAVAIYQGVARRARTYHKVSRVCFGMFWQNPFCHSACLLSAFAISLAANLLTTSDLAEEAVLYFKAFLQSFMPLVTAAFVTANLPRSHLGSRTGFAQLRPPSCGFATGAWTYGQRQQPAY